MTEKTFDITSSVSITNEFAEAIAEHRGIDELDPDFSLYDEFDVDAVERLMRSDSATDLRLQFRLDETVVRLEQNASEEFRLTVEHSDQEVLCK